MSSEDGKVGALTSLNLVLASAQTMVTNVEVMLRLLIMLTQLAVGVVTVWYIYRKARAVRNRK